VSAIPRGRWVALQPVRCRPLGRVSSVSSQTPGPAAPPGTWGNLRRRRKRAGAAAGAFGSGPHHLIGHPIGLVPDLELRLDQSPTAWLPMLCCSANSGGRAGTGAGIRRLHRRRPSCLLQPVSLMKPRLTHRGHLHPERAPCVGAPRSVAVISPLTLREGSTVGARYLRGRRSGAPTLVGACRRLLPASHAFTKLPLASSTSVSGRSTTITSPS
jgi:hypothetical protein